MLLPIKGCKVVNRAIGSGFLIDPGACKAISGQCWDNVSVSSLIFRCCLASSTLYLVLHFV